MKTEKNLYIKILVWAYKKQEAGFFEEDIFKEFNLSKEQITWYLKTFRSGLPVSENLIGHLEYKDNKHIFVLTAKGTSVAIAYLELEEAKSGSKRAEKIALFAIVINVVVAIFQIIFSLSK